MRWGEIFFFFPKTWFHILRNQKEGQSSGIKTESNAVYKCQSCDCICEWEPELVENRIAGFITYVQK